MRELVGLVFISHKFGVPDCDRAWGCRPFPPSAASAAPGRVRKTARVPNVSLSRVLRVVWSSGDPSQTAWRSYAGRGLGPLVHAPQRSSRTPPYMCVSVQILVKRTMDGTVLFRGYALKH